MDGKIDEKKQGEVVNEVSGKKNPEEKENIKEVSSKDLDGVVGGNQDPVFGDNGPAAGNCMSIRG